MSNKSKTGTVVMWLLLALFTSETAFATKQLKNQSLNLPGVVPVYQQQAYVKASVSGREDLFGRSIAISGNTLVVGGRGDNSSATGVNGNEHDNSALDAGAAYVFVRTGSGWRQQAYIKASNTEAYDRFGTSVAISGDTLVVGATSEDSNAMGSNGDEVNNLTINSGAAYVFTRTDGIWSQQAYLKASNPGVNDDFGSRVAISGDTLVVTAVSESSNATGINGDETDDSVSQAGAAYVFTRTGGDWSQQAYLKASNTGAGDGFGRSVSISGDTLVVGAYAEDSNATGVNGDEANDLAQNSGAAYVFTRTEGVWSQQAYLKASISDGGFRFGGSVAISGDNLVIGAYSADAAFVFTRAAGVWSEQAHLKASNSGVYGAFGESVAISGETLVVGANYESSNATGVNGDEDNVLANASGAAYVFTRKAGVWTQQAYLKASNTEEGDQFGGSVAITEGMPVVGAANEDGTATGVNGPQDNDQSYTRNSGAVYVFYDYLFSSSFEDGF